MTEQHHNTARDEIVFTRDDVWMPLVMRTDGALRLELGAGADANHDPREFSLPISERHLEVIRGDFVRHTLLWVALLPLCDDAGILGPLDEGAAVALLDPILLGSEAEVEALFKTIRWSARDLIAHHADPALLEQGNVFAATRSLTLASDWKLTHEYEANRERARRGVALPPLEAEVLKYTNQYLHGGGVPSRKPDAVDPEFLGPVLELISVAEQACAGMELPQDYGSDHTRRQADQQAWNEIARQAEQALLATYPTLVSDTVRSVSFLMCSEAATRARRPA